MWPASPQPQPRTRRLSQPTAPRVFGPGSVLPLGRPGFLLDFISCPVIKGFTSAAAITIGFGQVKVSTLAGAGVPAR